MVSFPKPKAGTFRRERALKARRKTADETKNKAIVRELDGYACRWKPCNCVEMFSPIEVAHVRSKSVGGSSRIEQLITLCASRHRGTVSLHSGLAKVEYLTDQGTRGICRYLEKRKGRWVEVGRDA